jgi:ABC-2 type transport system ATP-binding protein
MLDRVASDRLRVRARPAARAAELLSAFGPAETEAGADVGDVTARLAPDRVPEALRALLAAGVDVYSVERAPSSLEEVFLDITGGETV